MCRVILVIACVLSLTLPSEGQTVGNALSGLSKISILIEPVNHASKECGLSEKGIHDAVLYPLSFAIQVAALSLQTPVL